MNEDGAGGTQALTDVTGHAIVAVGDVGLAVFVEAQCVEGTVGNAGSATHALVDIYSLDHR